MYKGRRSGRGCIMHKQACAREDIACTRYIPWRNELRVDARSLGSSNVVVGPSELSSPMVWRQCSQCNAICRSGKRCSITSASLIVDETGRKIGEPLHKGSDRCRVHLDFFRLMPAVRDGMERALVVVFYDLETTGQPPTHSRAKSIRSTH